MERKILAGIGLVALLLISGYAVWWSVHSPRPDSSVPLPLKEDPERAGEAPVRDLAVEHPRERTRIEPRSLNMDKGDEKNEGRVTSEPEKGTPDRFLVMSEGGSPISGVTVSVYRRPYMGTPRQQVVSGPNGEAAFLSLRPGDELGAEAEGFVPTRIGLPERPWPSPFPLVLQRGKILCEGRVLDDIDRPVADATISMRYDGGTCKGRTKADGTFALIALDPPSAPFQGRFEIRSPSCCFLGDDCPVEIGKTPWKTVFRMHRWARLHVVVLDPKGSPLPDAGLRLGGPPEKPHRWRLPSGNDVTVRMARSGHDRKESTERGDSSLLIDRVPPLIPLYLRASHPLYEEKEMELGSFEPGEERSASIRFTKTRRTVVFRVRDRKGNPISGVEAGIMWNEDGATTSCAVAVDDKGTFRIEPPSETWDLFVKAEGFRPYSRTFTTASLPPAVETIVLERGGEEITVLVRDREGRPVPDMIIYLEEEGTSRCARTGRTNEKGETRFSGLDPDALCTVRFGGSRPGSYFPRTLSRNEVPSPAVFRGILPGERRLLFRLAPPGTISGSLDMENVSGKKLFLSLVEEGASGKPPVFTINTTLGSDGEFSFPGLPPGRYHLWMYGVEGGDRFSRPMAILDLHEGETLSGVVVKPR